MTNLEVSATRRPMARRKRFVELMMARFRAGTMQRIEAVLDIDEDRAEFVRKAVDRELERRERKKGRES